MPDKLPSEIIRITLDDATYKGTGAAIAPTYINYLLLLVDLEREKQP